MIVYLECPYEEKDQVKALGALWDDEKKKWYVENHPNLMLFKRWIPSLKNWKVPKSAARWVHSSNGKPPPTRPKKKEKKLTHANQRNKKTKPGGIP